MRSTLVGRLAGAAALLTGTVTVVLSVAAAPPAVATTGNYSGSASGNLVGASALTVPGTFQLANVSVAPSTALVNSQGLTTDKTGMTGPTTAGKDSYGRATNLDAQLLSGQVNLNNLLVEADQAAPPDNTKGVSKQLINVPADPIANATVATAFANARWAGADACVALGTDIAHSTSTVADANVLTQTPSQPTVSLVNDVGGAVTSDSTIRFLPVKGQTGLGVQSIQIDQLTSVILFKGTSNELDIDVAAPPEITAVATGNAATSTVEYTEPILTVRQGGKVLGTLNAKDNKTSISIPGVATLSLGDFTKKIAADGTSASGSADLLKVAIGTSPLPLNVATVTIAGASAAAAVPVGGVNCPPGPNPLSESHKDASATAVAPGQTFNYVITVPNRGSCTLDPVTVTDTLVAPSGTKVTNTPAANTTNGNTFTWSIGPLAPNETKNIVMSITVPTDAPNGFVFSDSGTVSGVCNNAPPGTPPFTQPISFTGPTVFAPSVNGCHLNESNKASDHLEVMPGESFNYYVHVLNDGTTPCTNVKVSDPLGSGVTFVSASNGGTESGGTVSWSLGTVGPGQSVTLVITVTANTTDTAGMTLPDTATITATEQPSGVKVSTPGPTVTTRSVLAPPNPAKPASATPAATSPSTSPSGTLPRTGGQPLAPLGLGLLTLGFAGWGWRRRVRLSS